MAKVKQDLRDFIIEQLRDIAETGSTDEMRMTAIRMLLAAIPPRDEREQPAQPAPTPTPTVREREEQERERLEEQRRLRDCQERLRDASTGRTCGHGIPQDVPLTRRVPRVE